MCDAQGLEPRSHRLIHFELVWDWWARGCVVEVVESFEHLEYVKNEEVTIEGVKMEKSW